MSNIRLTAQCLLLSEPQIRLLNSLLAYLLTQCLGGKNFLAMGLKQKEGNGQKGKKEMGTGCRLGEWVCEK